MPAVQLPFFQLKRECPQCSGSVGNYIAIRSLALYFNLDLAQQARPNARL
jgi:hypothetical protein